MICPQCKGKKILTCEVVDHSSNTTSSFETDCITCNGTGEVTAARKRQYDDAVASWCQCKGEHDSYYVPDTRHMKHHWRCSSCRKITQVG